MADEPESVGAVDTPESRQRWSRLADRATNDTAFAPEAARILAHELRQAAQRTAAPTPRDYVYHGVHHLIVRTRDLEPEPLPEFNAQGELLTPGVQITRTGNQPVPVRIPFNCIVEGVFGYAVPQATDDDGSEIAPFLLGAAPDYRDLFAVRWGLDGDIWYSSNGNDEQLIPASVAVGTQRFPRTLAWPVSRQRTLNVQFRNITNAYLQALDPEVRPTFVLSEAALVFQLLKVDPP